MMIQDPSVELVPQKVRTKDSKWSWKNILHESVSMKNMAQKTFEVPELKWTLDDTYLICFHSSQEVPDLLLSHSSPEVPDLILSHSSQDVPDDSVLCYHIHAGFSKNSSTESAAHRSAR